jgi:trans-2,3-dihydro-3-hydroxyanthranilate isomerase
MARAVYQVDAFTERLFRGNPAGVVPDGRGLDDATLLAIAREMGCPATAFLTPPSRAGCTHRIRFFTPTHEVALCGHATVASFHVLATLGEAASPAMMECKAGDLPVRFVREGERTRVTMTQDKGAFAAAPMRGVVSQSVTLPPDVVAPKPAPALVSTGVWVSILPVTAPEVLAHCVPLGPKIRALGGARPIDGIYVVALDQEAGPVAHVRARYFALEGMGIIEDAATGIAAGALLAWLAKNGRLAPGAAVTIEQGIEMSRPSTLQACIGPDGRPEVSGMAVTAFETTLAV